MKRPGSGSAGPCSDPLSLGAADVDWRGDVEERRRVAIDRLEELHDEPPEERDVENVEDDRVGRPCDA